MPPHHQDGIDNTTDVDIERITRKRKAGRPLNHDSIRAIRLDFGLVFAIDIGSRICARSDVAGRSTPIILKYFELETILR